MTGKLTLLVLLVAAAAGVLSAKPLHHYVYLAQDREKLRTTRALLDLKQFEGAQIFADLRKKFE